jgi:protein TonB
VARRRRGATFWLYAISLGLHVTLAVGAVLLPKPKRVESVAISLFEQKKPEPPKPAAPPPPPKPPPPKKEAPKAKAAPAAEPAEAKAAPPPPPAATPAADSMDGYADLGLAMGNGGGGGLAIPQPGSKVASSVAPPKATAAPVATTRKVRALAAKPEDTCDEPPVKPKPKSIVKPAYTNEARAGQIEGVVRVEITVDETGRVIQAKVLRGLGYGLDEAAVAAAKQMTFEPGTRCGKAAITTLSIGMRFALGS